MKRGYFFFCCVLCLVASSIFAQPLTGTKTIGGINPDYAAFSNATADLAARGVGTGGVVFYVRPGNYPEHITIPYHSSMSESNPVVFQKEPADTGTVTVSPTATTGTDAAIKLYGCRYVTFDSINVVDGSTGSNYIEYGYWITNSSATQGAQYNTIINCLVTLRKDFITTGVYQFYSTTPTSNEGTQSHNRYLNLKLSKMRRGLFTQAYNNTFPDAGCEIGSDSVGINYPRRFTVGAMVNDTIGGGGVGYGIYVSFTNGISIHDVDIRNVITTSGSALYGIALNTPITSSSNTIYNNRIYNITATLPSSFANIYAINATISYVCTVQIYNNMIYNLQSNSTGASPTANRIVYGLYTTAGNIEFNHNTILLNQGSGNNLHYSSADVEVRTSGNVTLRNNIFANTTAAQSSPSFHYCIYKFGAVILNSDYNVFYLPNTGNGVIGFNGTTNFTTVSDWYATTDQDSNSISGDPQFVSANDLHVRLDVPSPASNSGIMIDYIANDIDGDVRDYYHPDIGADEFLSPFSVREQSNQLPNAFRLEPVYPNPFNATATIRFTLPVTSFVKCDVFDITGRKVAMLVDGALNTGLHRVQFDGRRLASGSYLVRLTAGKYTAQQKIVLLK